MSIFTAVAGLDPLIAAARRKDWQTVVNELRKIIKKYTGDDGLASFDGFLDDLKGSKASDGG